jgi:putative oxidoreductase
MTTQQRTPARDTGFDKAIVAGTRWLADHSIDILRISLGALIAAFGMLKFFPGISPAEGLVEATVGELTLGLVDGRMAIVTTAAIEVVLGLALITGRFLKPAMVVFAGWIAGVMAPLVLFFDELFTGGGPTLEAQYVLKDVVFLAAGMVLAAKALGARMVADEPDEDRAGRR